MNAFYDGGAVKFFAETDETTRAAVRDNLIKMGASASEASLIIDMAIHAKNKAMDAISEICSSVPNENKINTFSMAVEVMRVECERMHDVLVKKMHEDGARDVSNSSVFV